MVQFELKLEENVVEKWREYYLDYKKLKKILKKCKKQKGNKNKTTVDDKWSVVRQHIVSSKEKNSSLPLNEKSGLLSSTAPELGDMLSRTLSFVSGGGAEAGGDKGSSGGGDGTDSSPPPPPPPP
mmetsp:Transcript_45421/g.91637  ORF Transcript_45421/g.91637 Transcript_45421/m.91637 type:complete len:125 (+) Transcript_45421:195-569(+)